MPFTSADSYYIQNIEAKQIMLELFSLMLVDEFLVMYNNSLMLKKINFHLKSIRSLLSIQITKIWYFSTDYSHNKKDYFCVYMS